MIKTNEFLKKQEELEKKAMCTTNLDELRKFINHPNLFVREAAMHNVIATDELIRERLEIEGESNVQVAGVLNKHTSNATVSYVANKALHDQIHDEVVIACMSTGKLTIDEERRLLKNNPRLERILESPEEYYVR